MSIRMVLLVGGLLGCASLAWADPPDELFRPRTEFLPQRKYTALEGKAIGLLVGDAQPLLSTEGRHGPPDQLCFTNEAASYRWVYVPAMAPAQITQLQVPTGKDGKIKLYPALNMASPRTLAAHGIASQYALVEIEVNDGLGSPANDSFVGSKYRVLDGTKEYPLKVNELIPKLRQRYLDECAKQRESLEQAMKELEQRILKGRQRTGPRETRELLFATWFQAKDELHVRLHSRWSDGAYQNGGGGAAPVDEVQVPPRRGRALPPPPLERPQVRTGTTYGIEFGKVFIVSKTGEVVRTQTMPVESFQQELQPPPGIRPVIDPPALPRR